MGRPRIRGLSGFKALGLKEETDAGEEEVEDELRRDDSEEETPAEVPSGAASSISLSKKPAAAADEITPAPKKGSLTPLFGYWVGWDADLDLPIRMKLYKLLT